MRNPDLFLVGAPKCGTSAMHHYLGRHPEIFMCPLKEPEFFSRDPGSGPALSLAEYLSYFEQARDEKRIGESSVGYLASPHAAARIKAFNPRASILVMLRNPVDMIHSLHSQRLYNGDEDVADLEEALDLEERRARGSCLPRGVRSPGQALYRPVARYTDQIGRYLEQFGWPNVHVVIFDDLARDPGGVYAGVVRFLGVDPAFRPRFDLVNPNKQVHSVVVRSLLRNPPAIVRWLAGAVLTRPVRRRLARRIKQLNVRYVPRAPMDPELRRRLQAEFAPEVERLSALVGRDLHHWQQP
jgi:hypothetical protein